MKNVTSFFNLLMVWWGGDASPTSPPPKTATAYIMHACNTRRPAPILYFYYDQELFYQFLVQSILIRARYLDFDREG